MLFFITEQRYKPFGETRYRATTGFPTDFQFTGQRYEVSTGLYDYVARMYDPVTGHFISADTVFDGWDRYAYTRNNPIRYTDPSGHGICDGPLADNYEECREKKPNKTLSSEDIERMVLAGGVISTEELKAVIFDLYGWSIWDNFMISGGSFEYSELVEILRAGYDLRNMVDDLTDGKGKEWIQTWLGDASFVKRPELCGTIGAQAFVLNNVYMNNNTDAQTIVHELGHVFDNKIAQWSGNNGLLPAVIAGGGGSDIMIQAISGKSPTGIRFQNGVGDYLSDAQKFSATGSMYGNTGTAEYFAQTLEYLVYRPNDLPADAKSWMQTFIALSN